MKKFFGILVAAMLVAGLAGQASAAFTANYTLVRAVYDVNYDTNGNASIGSYEIATSLLEATSTAALNSALSGSNVVLGGGTNAFTNYTTADFANLRVAYFAVANSPRDLWIAGEDQLTSLTAKWGTASGAANQVITTYRNASTAASNATTVTVAESSASSYWNRLVTSFGGYLTTGTADDVSLADLATIGYVDQTLYFFDNSNSAISGAAVATLRTMENGSTVANPVPVPPALYLLGSGLIGLLGLRRKKIA